MPHSTGTGSTAAGGTFESDTDGTYQSDTPGTFQTVTDGTFHSAMTGTFQSDTGGTSIPLLSLQLGFSLQRMASGVRSGYQPLQSDVAIPFQVPDEIILKEMSAHLEMAISTGSI